MYTDASPSNFDDIRDRRQRARLTVAQLAHAADVSLSFLSAVEHGYRPKRSVALRRVDAALCAAEETSR